MDHETLKLARTVRESPGDKAAVQALLHALEHTGDLPAIAALLECCASLLAGSELPATAMGSLYCHLAAHAESDGARALARSALELMPSSGEALALFEQHAGPDDLQELCDRYLAFLAAAPFHPRSPRVRVTLIDRLLEAGRYDEALGQVSVLPPPCSLLPVSADIERACAIAPMPPRPRARAELRAGR